MNLNFLPPTTIQTSGGIRSLRICRELPGVFWTVYREHKEALAKQGFTVRKSPDGSFELWHVRYPEPSPQKTVSLPSYSLQNASGLLQYQIPIVGGICASLLSQRKALDASEMGVGKTYHALAAARELGLTPLIICPLAVIPSWKRVCAHFRVEPGFIVNWEGCKSKKFRYGQLLRSQYDKSVEYRWHIHPNQRVLFIFDEAHRGNGNGTGFSKILMAAQDYMVLMCTGTPATRLREFRAIGSLLGLFNQYTFTKWLESQGNYKTELGFYESLSDEEDMARLHAQIFPRYGVRVRKADISGFPEVQNICEALAIPKPDAQDKAYHVTIEKICGLEKSRIKLQERRKLLLAYQSAEYKEDVAHLLSRIRRARMQQMVLYLRYRQLAEKMKVSGLVEYAKELQLQGYSVVIFCNFNDTVNELLKKLPKAVCIRGGQKSEERAHALQHFQSNVARVIVCNIDAGGVGISLHDELGGHPRVSLICPNPSAIKTMQALGRIHRAGAKSCAVNRILFAGGTIEEKKVLPAVQERMRSVGRLVDGDLSESDVLRGFVGEQS